MDFKDYYRTLGVDKTATPEVIKRAYRKLARKYHPDVSSEPDAEARFKEIAEAHEALGDPERRAAYDDLALRRARGDPFDSNGASAGYEFGGRGAPHGFGHAGEADFGDFFESLFGRSGRAAGRAGAEQAGSGRDHHARIDIDIADAFTGGMHTIALRQAHLDEQGRRAIRERSLEVHIPMGVRPGQQLRLKGQGEAGDGAGPAGDLYLEVGFRPHPRFRLDGADLWVDLPVSPWEAALGANLPLDTPAGEVQVSVPPQSGAHRKLRLKGRGLPGKTPGDLYAQIQIVQPRLETQAQRDAYAALASAFPTFNPRSLQEA